MSEKKAYETPELVVYGDVRKLTQTFDPGKVMIDAHPSGMRKT